MITIPNPLSPHVMRIYLASELQALPDIWYLLSVFITCWRVLALNVTGHLLRSAIGRASGMTVEEGGR